MTRRRFEGRESRLAKSWDAEYSAGRYRGENSIPFARDILACVGRQTLPSGRGLYVGCGNGRNYLALFDGGIDLVGIDLSGVALAQLADRAPRARASLLHGDLSALPAGEAFAVVIGIQVFQHGNEAEAHAHIAAALARLLPGGLFCLRVNAAATEVGFRHRVVERNTAGGFTVEYEEGPKAGLTVHFFAEAELEGLLGAFQPVLGLRLDTARRALPREGGWAQWEGIWRRRPGDVENRLGEAQEEKS